MHETDNSMAMMTVAVDLLSTAADIAVAIVALELVRRLGAAYARNFAPGRES